MSEEQKRESAAETDHGKAVDPVESNGSGDAEGSSGVEKLTRSIEKANPVVLLLFMILFMLVVLAMISLRGGGSKDSGAGSDDPVLAALKADVEARRSELNRQRMAMGLPPLEGGSEPIEDIAKRLKKDADTIVGLAGRYQQMLGEKDSEISARNSEVLRLEKLRQDVSFENARLQSELQRALLGSAETDRIKTMLADSQAQRDALSRELAEAAGAVNAEDYADLQRRYEEALRAKEFYEDRSKQLEADLGKMSLFAKSEDELLPAAVQLFRRLRKLEGMKDSDLTTEYSKLGVDLGASVLHTLSFKTGSNELSEDDRTTIQNLVAEIPEGDLALVIGYASKTGDSVANERLSSDRATAGAEQYAASKRPGQLVQAVYLGQTDRFSSRIPERNQICEIWRIRRK